MRLITLSELRGMPSADREAIRAQISTQDTAAKAVFTNSLGEKVGIVRLASDREPANAMWVTAMAFGPRGEMPDGQLRERLEMAALKA